MIHHAVGLVANRLNQHLKVRLQSPDDLVAVSTLTDHEGKPAAQVRNRLVLFVTDICEETAARSVQPRRTSGDRMAVTAQPVHLNVFFMTCANFDPQNYLEALKVLSHSVQFFQSNQLLNQQNAPEMPPGLEQLNCEINNLAEDTNSHLWGIHGGRYVPSVHYKMRLITIDSDTLIEEQPLVTGVDTDVIPRAGASN